MRKRGQKDAVIKFMEHNGAITARMASDMLGVDRLAARIADIKEILNDTDKLKYYGWERFKGRYIVTEYEYITNRYGNRTRIARYRLNVDADEEHYKEA